MPSTVNIADKATLDSVKYDTTALKSRGGFKSTSGALFGFNPTTSEWEEIRFDKMSGANATLVIINDNLTSTDITVEHEDGWFETTFTMPDVDYYTVAVPALGNYIVSYGQTTKNVTIDEIGGIVLE